MILTKDTSLITWSDWFYYDETSPTFLRWRVDRYRGKKLAQKIISSGDVAGSNNVKTEDGNNGYSSVTLHNKTYATHRVIWEMLVERLGRYDHIDHLDGNRHNNKLNNLRKVTKSVNARNVALQRRSKTGVIGVNFNSKVDGDYYVAVWVELSGKRCSRHFSISKMGKDEAFRLACEYRSIQISWLNLEGADYSSRHGT